MQINRTLYVPASLANDTPRHQLGPRIRKLALSEVGRTTPLVPINSTEQRIKIAVSFTAVQLEAARGDAHRGGNDTISDGALLTRLALTAMSRDDKSRDLIAQAATGGPAPGGIEALITTLRQADPRPPQRAAARAADDAYGRRRIGLVEASTGTGKGLVAAAAAYQAATQGHVAVVAAPTHAIVRQLRRELTALMQANGPVTVRVLKGRAEYVAADRVEALIQECEVDDASAARELGRALRRWAGAQPGAVELKGDAAGDEIAQAAWTLDSLLEAVPDAPAESLRLRAGDSEADLGHRMYLRQRAYPEDVRIVLCTHAMLAHDLNARAQTTRHVVPKRTPRHDPVTFFLKTAALRAQADAGEASLLPAYTYLVVDEAHLLEQSFAASRSVTASLSLLTRRLRRLDRGPGAAMRLERLQQALDTLEGLVAPGDGLTLTSQSAPVWRCLQQFTEAAEACTGSLKRARKIDVAARETVIETVADVQRALRARGSVLTQLDVSPVLGQISVTQGPRSVAAALAFLWARLTGPGGRGALCLSATLYLPTSRGIMSSAYVRKRLNIDALHLAEYPPIVAPWVTRHVTLHTPGIEEPSRFTPTGDQLEAEAAWHQQVADSVAEIVRQTSGGVLVLCTSYRTTAALAARLDASRGGLLDHEASLMVSAPGQRLVDLQQAFVAQGLAGRRSIWLATGGAWTGVDLSPPDPVAVPAEADQIATTLVIPRLPFGLEKTTTQLARSGGPGNTFSDALESMLILFKQGLGRLVRRPGLEGRSIWVLDARLQGQSYSQQVRQLLAPYTHGRDDC